jgi:hypothetical protein
MKGLIKPSSLFAVVVAAVFLPSVRSGGDIGIFGGVGQSVFPITSEDIRMASERVTIAVGPPGKGGGFADLPLLNVNAQFVFHNESANRLNVQMGFPDQQGRVPGERAPRSLVEKLAVRSNGLAVKIETKKGVGPKDASLPHYDQVFVWNCSFAPGEKKKVEVSYIVRMSALSEFDLADTEEEYELTTKERVRLLRFYREILPLAYSRLAEMSPEDYEMLSPGRELWMVQSGFLWGTGYVLQTGALWKGTIGQAYIEADFSRFLKSVDPLEVPLPILEGHSVALIQPEGFRWQGPKLIWEMRDFEPAEDVQVGFLTVFYVPRDAATLRQWLTSKDGKKLSKSTLTMLKDCVLALHGRTSKDPLLKTFFENSMPYAHAKRHAPKQIPRTAQEIVAEIDKALGRL